MEHQSGRWCPHFYACAGGECVSEDSPALSMRPPCASCGIRVRMHSWELEPYIVEEGV